ncbi:MAG: hypothetical protein CSB49_08350, partial [Proteobacteria bacterium]
MEWRVLNPRLRSVALVAAALIGGACASAAKDSPDQGIEPLTDGQAFEGSVGDGLPGDGVRPGAAAIYVSKGGVDTPTCGKNPAEACKTITRGITRAATFTPPRSVRVAGGSYLESVDLVDEVSVYGGYNQTFTDGPAKETTTIEGKLISGEAIAVQAANITTHTELAHVTIRAPDAESDSASSYGVLVGDSPGLVLSHLTIEAGKGGSGGAVGTGKPGAAGDPGGKGVDGVSALPLPLPLACGSAAAGAAGYYGEGGKSSCGQPGGNGGKGDFISITGGCDGQDGIAGSSASGATAACSASTPGRAGKGGKDGKEKDCSGTPTLTRPGDGAAGCAGASGDSGDPGVAGAEVGGVTASGLYQPADGGAGKTGEDGLGGGGGGGGGSFSSCSLPEWGGGGGG